MVGLTLRVCYRSEHIVPLRHSVTIFGLHFHLLHFGFRKGFRLRPFARPAGNFL